jgi:hypothetical protein
MKRLDQQGSSTGWLIAFIISTFLFVGVAIFGFWAFSERNDYKNNTDAKVVAAVEEAQQQTSAAKTKEFEEKEKNPYRTYVGPGAYGSISISYPKTWSAYVDETSTGASIIDGYYNPATVPAIQSKANFALRVQVITQSYTQIVTTLSQQLKNGKFKMVPYRADKVPSVTGVRVDGEVSPGKQGSLIILPVRDKTLKIWSEAPEFVKDLDAIVLPNLTFVP